MLTPLNVIVFDSTDVEQAAVEYFGNRQKARYLLINLSLDLSDEESIVSMYLPGPKEREFYAESTCDLADVIVKYSTLEYGDTAYIMF